MTCVVAGVGSLHNTGLPFATAVTYFEPFASCKSALAIRKIKLTSIRLCGQAVFMLTSLHRRGLAAFWEYTIIRRMVDCREILMHLHTAGGEN